MSTSTYDSVRPVTTDVPEPTLRQRLGRGFFLVRLSLLLTLLGLTGFWGYGDIQSRNARTHWDHTLSVAVVIVTTAPVEPASVRKLEARLGELEALLAREFWRYRQGPLPFRLVLQGVARAGVPPEPPSGVFDLARHGYQQWSYLSSIDAQVGLNSARYDSRIYVVARPPADTSIQFVEGYSQQGGRVGIVQVELNEEMVDLVLSVTAHELLHTLGAEDKYDATGHTLIPEGLAEPDKHPRFPQRYVEVMTRNRVLSETEERILDDLSQLRVGPLTAREIGWAPAQSTSARLNSAQVPSTR